MPNTAPQLLEPQLMKMAVLTNAVQYPKDCTRECFRKNPIDTSLEAALTWIDGASEIKLDGIQLGGALHELDSYVPAEQMLDPVASHIPIRTYREGGGEDLSDADAATINERCAQKNIVITDIGIFENLLNPDAKIRDQVHSHILRAGRAAKKLASSGCKGVTSFIGRDTGANLDRNLVLFERWVVPILRAYDEMGLVLRIENCPMPGWSPAETFIQNIACTPAVWITLARIAEKHGLGRALRFTYDESHSILMHSRMSWVVAVLIEAGYGHLIDSTHAKDQNQNPALIAAHNCLGRRIGLGIHDPEGNDVSDAAKLGGAWGRMNSQHSLPGFTLHNSYAEHLGRQADWLEHQYNLRLLGLDVANSFTVLEHEQVPLRDQNWERVLEAIWLSSQFMRAIDAAADAQFRISKWCPIVKEGLFIVRAHDPMAVLPGIKESAESILAIPV